MPKGKVGTTSKKKKQKGYVDYYLRRELAARSAMTSMSALESARTFGLSVPTVKYWIGKARRGDNTRGRHGGKRHSKLSDEDKIWLRELAVKFPKTSLTTFKSALSILTGTSVTEATISRYFTSLGWSYHGIEHKQRLKYTAENMERYVQHIMAMPDIVADVSMERVKFLDEVHYVTKNLHKRKGVGPRGKRIVLPVDCDLSESYSMTLLTTLNGDGPFEANLRVNSNTQHDFCLFLCRCIRSEFLVEGDVLVMDNASVHVGTDTFSVVMDILAKVNIRLILLPAYSPELNPAEYVFAFVKNNLRWHRTAGIPLWQDIMIKLHGLTPDALRSMYRKCIYYPKMG